MKKKFLIGFMITVSVLILNGCAKDGETGPAGKDGQNGNANVSCSTVTTLNNWNSAYDDGIYFTYEHDVYWTGLTQAIKDKGVVMVYYMDGPNNDWVAIPYTQEDTGYFEQVAYYFGAGKLTMEITGYDNSGSPGASAYNGVFIIRIVAIAASSRVAHPEVDLKNYNEVKKIFNIKD